MTKPRFWVVGMLAVMLAMVPLAVLAYSSKMEYDASASILHTDSTQLLPSPAPNLAELVSGAPAMEWPADGGYFWFKPRSGQPEALPHQGEGDADGAQGKQPHWPVYGRYPWSGSRNQ